MRRYLIIVGMIAAYTMLTGTAMADSIKGRFGVTGRLGLLAPSGDSKFVPFQATSPLGTVNFVPLDDKIKTSTSFAGGGGFIYGITDNLAVEVDVTHAASIKAETAGVHIADISTTDVSLGLQYRIMPESKFVPYLGAGVDVLVSDIDLKNTPLTAKIDTVAGGHVNVGADFFITKNIAFNVDFRGIFAPKADVKTSGTETISGLPITVSDTKTAEVDPLSFAALFGVRFFFN